MTTCARPAASLQPVDRAPQHAAQLLAQRRLFVVGKLGVVVGGDARRHARRGAPKRSPPRQRTLSGAGGGGT